MPLKPKTEVPTERIQITVPVHVHQLVKAYAEYLGHDTDPAYVYSEAAAKVIRGDHLFDSSALPAPGRRRTPAKPPVG